MLGPMPLFCIVTVMWWMGPTILSSTRYWSFGGESVIATPMAPAIPATTRVTTIVIRHLLASDSSFARAPTRLVFVKTALTL